MRVARQYQGFILSTLALVAVSCSSDIDGDPQPLFTAVVGTCVRPLGSGAPGSCEHLLGADYTDALARSRCSGNHGQYATTPCPSQNIVGVCRLGQGTHTEIKLTYYSPGFDTAAATRDCGNQGTFYPP